MAEAKKALTLMSAVGANMDRLRQSIGALRDLLDRWKDPSGTCINLIAQLTALKSNLGEMQDYINYAIDDMHPQLLSDLDVLMASCGLLVRHVDALVARLRQPDHDDVDWANKIKFTIGGRSMGKLKNVAKRQADAVNLLLAACKCHTTAQRKILLHKSRQIRKEDSTSLTVMARSSRWNGRCISSLTQLSRMIHWFRVIFYIKLFKRGPEEEVTEQDYLDAAAAMRSEAIDRALEEDATTLRRETKLVLMGQPNGGKELIMRQMKVLYADGYPKEERIGYRYAMRSTIRLLIHSIIDLIKDTGINLSAELTNSFAILLDEVESIDDHQHITRAAVGAVHSIWSSEAFNDIYVKNFEIDFPQYASYFAHAIARIAEDDYVPSEADIIRLNQSIGGGGVKELRFNWDELDIRLFNISGYIPNQFRKRWFHQLEGAAALIYVIDISIYDRPYLGQTTESQLLDEFATFESWANSPKFSGSSVILLLNNFTRFREKLPHSPLSTFFSDYVPQKEDPETSARQYILRRFKDVNRNRLSVYSFWVDLDMSDNQHLYAALKKTLHHIQTKKARNEVNASSSTLETRKGGLVRSLSNLGSRNGTLGSRNGTASSKKGNSVDLRSPMMSEKSMLSSNASKGSGLIATMEG